MSPDELRREFEARAPWVTKFVIDGIEYGGKYDPYKDPRTDWFFEEFPDSRTILDLGSLEGAQSFRLAERSTVEQVLGLEVRPKNLDKANFVREILDIDKVRFAEADLEKEDLRRFGRFDAVFCAGVLYHLPKPWSLIEQISRLTDNLFIWTHYAADDRMEHTIHGYRGWFYKEFGWEDAQSGVSSESFWLLFDDLLNMIRDYGFEILRIIDKTPVTPNGPITALSAHKTKA